MPHVPPRIWRIAPLTYWGVVWFIRLCMFVYTRSITVEGLANVPKSGGVILVSNHLNNADPCIIPGVMKRRIVSMAKKEMFKWPVISLIFRFIGAFPVDRQGADLAALREAQNVVNSGLMLLMFPLYAAVTLNDTFYDLSCWAARAVLRLRSPCAVAFGGLCGEVAIFGTLLLAAHTLLLRL